LAEGRMGAGRTELARLELELVEALGLPGSSDILAVIGLRSLLSF
jgi:hypothetical protein